MAKTHKNTIHPILYSFRRCPYAMRGRMGLIQSGISVELREIVLRDKPQEMLDASPKGTVPVLILPDGTVIDESLDIMLWALQQNDPDNWLAHKEEALELIAENDGWYKKALDRYKYPSRYPDEDCSGAQNDVQKFFHKLNEKLEQSSYLITEHITLADIAIFPFIRQGSKVDEEWFSALGFTNLENWLKGLTESTLFKTVMHKYKPWANDTSAHPVLLKRAT